MEMKCWVCGVSTKGDEYCPEHGKEYPKCKCFRALMGDGINVCLPNSPYSCRRSHKERLCDTERDCEDCGIYNQVDITGQRVCIKSPLVEKESIDDYVGFMERAKELAIKHEFDNSGYIDAMGELTREWSAKMGYDRNKRLYGKQYAHSVKNPHIKHWVVDYNVSLNKKPKIRKAYLCQPSSSITPEKVAKIKEEITCKNCLKELDKGRENKWMGD